MSGGTDFMLAKLAQLRGDTSLDYSRPSGLAMVTALLLLVVTVATWRRCFSPLSDLPGPFWASITRLWHVKIIIAGDQNLVLSRLHEKYGHFVRMAPGEVSVTHPDAVRKIFLNPLRKVNFPQLYSMGNVDF